MKKILKNIVVSAAVFVVIFGLTVAIQAVPYGVGGQVFDTDGNTVDGVNVEVECIETEESLSGTTEQGGWYSVSLGNDPYPAPVPGQDNLRIVATYGTLTNTTTVQATGTPQTVNLILREPVPPTVEFIPPTPANGSTNTTGHVNFTVNVTESVPDGGVVDDTVNISVWNETEIYLNNETMYAFDEPHKYYYDAQLPDGNYTYKAYAEDIAGNTGVSETRVLTVNVTEYSFSIEFVTDYNMIPMPVNDTSIINASSLATEIGENCTQISKWDAVNQQYVTYAPPNPLNNFDIVGGEGYFVIMTDPASVVFEGKAWSN